eukprot:Partr_v1_DN27391_c4_g2_i1_m46250 putative solute carrier family 11 (proton-coupled divalent metal ion transporters), member
MPWNGWKQLLILDESDVNGNPQRPEDVETEVVQTTDRNFNWRTCLKLMGPGFFVAIGYMDPGNWATGIEGGANFEYMLLCVILSSSILAWFLQILCIKLGVVTGNDLAQQCRLSFGRRTNLVLYVLAESAIIATDLAEVIGSAIALKLLFGIPMLWGVVLTGLDILIILKWYNSRYQKNYEYFIGVLAVVVLVCFCAQLSYTRPRFVDIMVGFLPNWRILGDRSVLYMAVGILGATVMPHNIYLHSSLCKARVVRYTNVAGDYISMDDTFMDVNNMSVNDDASSSEHIMFTDGDSDRSTVLTIKYLIVDVSFALLLAFFVNAMILIVSASAFYGRGGELGAATIESAYHALADTISPVAATFFAVALLASGQSSTITGTIAGQIVMSGFLDMRLKPWFRRLVTRAFAIIPAIFTILVRGEKGMQDLLILSQVILSVQLPFAIVPLAYFTSSGDIMKNSVNSYRVKILAYSAAGFVSVLNVYLVLSQFR